MNYLCGKCLNKLEIISEKEDTILFSPCEGLFDKHDKAHEKIMWEKAFAEGYEEGNEEGYDEGYKEGYKEGYEEGYDDNEKTQD